MADCYMYDFPGRSIRLKFLAEDPKLKAAKSLLEAMDELGDIIVPLCAGMSLRCINRMTWGIDWKVQAQKPFHHIYQSPVPRGIVVRLSADKSIYTPTERLSKKVLYSWIENALNQPSPQPDTHDVTWSELDFQAVRAKIYDDSQFKNQKFMVVEHDKRGDFRFPLKNRDDGLWVYSPIADLKTEPSFTIRTTNEGGAVTIDIHIHWTWWTKESLKDRDALEAAILRIIARGWTIEYLHESLNFPRLKSIFEASGKLPR